MQVVAVKIWIGFTVTEKFICESLNKVTLFTANVLQGL